MKRLALLLAALLIATPAAAQKLAGITIPASFTADGANLVLNGAGIRKKAFIKVYVGALYTETRSDNGASIIEADAPMAIRLFMTSGLVTREKMLGAINEGFEIATAGNLAPLQSRIDTLNGYFSDAIEEGDVFDLAYLPEKGVMMRKNGKPRGVIEGLDFKQALFAIWLGNSPADKKLKKGMLN